MKQQTLELEKHPVCKLKAEVSFEVPKGVSRTPDQLAEKLNQSTVLRLAGDEEIPIYNTEFNFSVYNWPDYGFHIERRREIRDDSGVIMFRAWRCKDWNPTEQGTPPRDIPVSGWRETEELAIIDLLEKVIENEGY